MKRHAAFFDFDGTLIMGDSQVMEMRHTLRYGYIPAANIFRIISTLFIGILSYSGLIPALCQNRVYIKTCRGISKEDSIRIGKNIFQSQIRKKFILQTIMLLEKHREEGALIAIVSAATDHILEPVREYLNPDFIICTSLETDSMNRFTGNPSGRICIGEEKIKRIHHLAVENGIDLALSYAYSDHHSDMPLLEAVGNPSAVNPTVRLERIARKRGWPIFRFEDTFSM